MFNPCLAPVGLCEIVAHFSDSCHTSRDSCLGRVSSSPALGRNCTVCRAQYRCLREKKLIAFAAKSDDRVLEHLASEIASRKCGRSAVFLFGVSISGFSLAVAGRLLDELLRAGRALLLHAASYLCKRTRPGWPRTGCAGRHVFDLSRWLYCITVDFAEFP